MPRFYCDTRPADSGCRQLPYVVIDQLALDGGVQPNGVIARFQFIPDAEAFRDLKRAEIGEEAPV